MTRLEIPVAGLHCEGCERALQAALGRLEGVRHAVADHRAQRVRVSFDPERVDERRLRETIEACGCTPVAEGVG
jgi:copper chaperone CopZ